MNVVMPNIVMMTVVPNVIKLSVIILSVVAPFENVNAFELATHPSIKMVFCLKFEKTGLGIFFSKGATTD